ncbi:MAG: cell division protein FtsZ [Neisseria sp.]|nr:cell division protein FtsZ [Neisseria sp.]
MDLVYDVVESAVGPAVIKVIGVGGGGCNAINNMIANSIPDVEFISANTDVQSLNKSQAPKRIQLGANLTKGLGAGTKPEIGRDAALEAREEIAAAIQGSNMLFITTGMGGGTGTGAAPVVAEIAKDMGILTVAVVTRPFEHEGKRIHVAQQGIQELKGQVDSLIVIPNDKLMTALGEDVTMREAFLAADNVLYSAVASISEVVTRPGFMNVDFADVKTVMGITGMAMMGSGAAQGKDRAREAAEEAIASPLLDNVSLDGARGVLVNITTAPDCLRMSEYREVTSIIDSMVHPDAEIKYGTAEDENMPEDAIRVTIIATGLTEGRDTYAAAPQGRRVLRRDVFETPAYAPQVQDDYGAMEAGVVMTNRGRKMNLSTQDSSPVFEDLEVPAYARRMGKQFDE